MSVEKTDRENFLSEGLIILGLALGLAMWFWLDLWLGGGLIGGDIYTYYFPQKAFLADSLKQGHLPWWNSLVGMGYPLVGESQTAAFYPPNWLLYRLLPLNIAYNVSHLLHYILAFVAMVLLARELRLSLGASLLAALVFVYGWFAPRCCLEWAIITGAYLPLSLWLLLSYLRTENGWWLWGLAASLGLQLLAGHYNLAFITLLTLFGWLVLDGFLQWKKSAGRECEKPSAEVPQLASSFWKRTARRQLFPLLAIVLAGLLAGAQLLPTWSLKQQSQRQTATSDDFKPGYGHLPPSYLTQLFLPWYWYGSPEKLPARLAEAPWAISAGTNPVEAHLYFGLLPFGLMLLGAGSILRGKNEADRQLRWLGVIGIFGMVYATGWLLPLTISLPGFSYFSGPGRFGLLTTLAAALWAARGWEVLKSYSPPRLRGVLWTIVFVGTLLDLSWVSQRITYAFMVPETPLTVREESIVRQLLQPQLPPARLFAPGPNLATITGVAATPVYLGIGPAEYFDPALKFPQEEGTKDLPFGAAFTPAQVAWLQRAGVTHVLGFAPPPAERAELTLIWSGFDPLLNPAWGRQEPLYLSELSGSRGRAAWLTPDPLQRLPVSSQAAEASLQWLKYSPDLIELEVNRAEGGTLVLTDLYDEDWQFTVDGKPHPQLRVEGMYRGAELPAGKHLLQWSYKPWSVRWGLGLSFAGFTILILFGVSLACCRKNALS